MQRPPLVRQIASIHSSCRLTDLCQASLNDKWRPRNESASQHSAHYLAVLPRRHRPRHHHCANLESVAHEEGL